MPHSCRGALTGQGGVPVTLNTPLIAVDTCASLSPLTPPGQFHQGDLRGEAAVSTGHGPKAGYSNTMPGTGALPEPCSGASRAAPAVSFHCLVPALPAAQGAQGLLPSLPAVLAG